MFKYFKKVLFLFSLLVIVSSCQKESEKFITTDPGTTVDASIFGIVVDENQEPIQGASIVYNGQSLSTDEYGVYKFVNVKVNSKHNHINIIKEGYFEGSRTFRTNHTKTLTLKTQLLNKSFDQSFASDQVGTVNSERATLVFQPNSVMVASSEEPYSGMVKVAMKYMDPTQLEINEQMPGDLSALNTAEEVGTLASYGMVNVELQSPSGQKLQIKTGSTVEMSTKIPSELVSQAQSTIPMWYYDYSSGIWKEEGFANLSGDTFTANVSHFSSWNYDYYAPSIVLSGRVIDDNGSPVSGVHVWVSEQGEWGGGHGNTDADGTFSGPVTKDVILDIRLFSYNLGCSYQDPFYETQIGPFNSDTDLGDITVVVPSSQTLTVEADFINCDLDPVTNGFVRIGYSYFALDGNTFNQTIIVCNTDNKTLIAVDRDVLKQTEPIILTSPGVEMLGTVNVCELDADFIMIKCDLINFSDTFSDSLTLYSIQNGSRKGIVGNSISASSTYISIGYDDVLGQQDFETGTRPLTEDMNLGLYDSANNYIWYTLNNGTITINEGGSIGDIIKGSFNMNVKNNSDNQDYDFYGNFQITHY